MFEGVADRTERLASAGAGKLAAAILQIAIVSALSCAVSASSGPSAGRVGGGRLAGSDGQERGQGLVVLDLRLDAPQSVDGCDVVWLDVSDSRCPLGVECVWEGEALVALSIACDGEAARRVQLSSRSGGESSTVFAFGRRLSLLRVDPLPVDGVRPEREKYRARLEIRDSGEGES